MWLTSNKYLDDMLKTMYNFSSTSRGVLRCMYYFMFLPGIVLSTILHNKFSLRASLLIVTLIITAGALFKLLTTVHHAFLFIGQGLWTLTHPSIIFASALVAVNWFEDSKRVLMLSIFVSFSFTAYINGFGFSTLVADYVDRAVTNIRLKLLVLYLVKAIFWIVVLLILYITFESEPKYPPSQSSWATRDDDVIGTYRQLCLNRQFMLLTFSQVFYYIMLTSLDFNFDNIWSVYKIKQSQADEIRIISTVSGLFGSLALGIFLHYTKMYKTANILTGVLSIWSLIAILLYLPKSITGVCIMNIFYGFSKYLILTIWYIYWLEIAYPLKETTVLGFIALPSIILGHGIGFISTYFISKNESKVSICVFVSLMCFSAAIGVILAWFMKPVNYHKIRYSDVGKNFIIVMMYRDWVIYST